MLVLPNWLTDVICVMPAMRPNMRSSGVATEEAIVSGLAPGRLANTLMVGYSTSGRGATGIWGKATPPASNKATVSSEVAMGRSIKGADMFTGFNPQFDGPEPECLPSLDPAEWPAYRTKCRPPVSCIASAFG